MLKALSPFAMPGLRTRRRRVWWIQRTYKNVGKMDRPLTRSLLYISIYPKLGSRYFEYYVATSAGLAPNQNFHLVKFWPPSDHQVNCSYCNKVGNFQLLIQLISASAARVKCNSPTLKSLLLIARTFCKEGFSRYKNPLFSFWSDDKKVPDFMP